MASSTLTAYRDGSDTVVFTLVSTSATGAVWTVSGRSLSAPYSISIDRKINSSGAMANDHVILRISETELNATTGKPATLAATLDISIPKDQSILTPTVQKYLLKRLASLLNDQSATAATFVSAVALIEGRDL